MKLWVRLPSGVEELDDVPVGQVSRCLMEHSLAYRHVVGAKLWSGRKVKDEPGYIEPVRREKKNKRYGGLYA